MVDKEIYKRIKRWSPSMNMQTTMTTVCLKMKSTRKNLDFRLSINHINSSDCEARFELYTTPKRHMSNSIWFPFIPLFFYFIFSSYLYNFRNLYILQYQYL